MDTLFWTALNPKIRILDTVKMMYGQHLYRLEIQAEGASILRDLESDIVTEVTNRNLLARTVNYGGSWRRNKPVSVDRIPLLEKIREVMLTNPGNKTRIEGDSLQFYTPDEVAIKKLARQMIYLDNSHISSIMRPTTPALADILRAGKVLRKNPPEYKYRLMIRDGRYSEESKENLLNWVDQMGDAVRIPVSLRENLEKGRHGYIWGGYIYVNDPRLEVMLRMIEPRLIGKIEEFHTA